LGGMFWKQNQWDDEFERALAFDLIGAHLLKATKKRFGGETLAFVLPLNHRSHVPVRPGFSRYGADLYFTTDGLPALIETPDGRQVQRFDKDWQYWKFVWRSTLLGTITLIDHLHVAHFRSANIYARASRKALGPDHPLRRFLSIFTFGSIHVNSMMTHALLGTRQVLHRSTPFANFEDLSNIIPTSVPSITELHKPFLDEATWKALPEKIKETPYFADGRLLFDAIRHLLDSMNGILMETMCTGPNGTLTDGDIIRLRIEIIAEDAEAGYASGGSFMRCRDMNDHLLAFLWTVTGWHRHVGQVADYYANPDIAGFSWKEGEAYPRPKQAFLMSIVSAFIGTAHPKLMEDYGHIFKGIAEEERFVGAWNKFRNELKDVQDEIEQRNANRVIKNRNAEPSLVECSVAV